MRWTKEEISLFKSLHTQGKTPFEMAERLGRSVNSIRDRHYDCGLKTNRKGAWSEEEKDLLERYAEMLPPSEIAKKIKGRTEEAIKHKMHRLGLSFNCILDNWTFTQFYKLIKVNYRTLRVWINKGYLQSYKVKGTERIKRSHFLQFYYIYKAQLPALQRISQETINWLK